MALRSRVEIMKFNFEFFACTGSKYKKVQFRQIGRLMNSTRIGQRSGSFMICSRPIFRSRRHSRTFALQRLACSSSNVTQPLPFQLAYCSSYIDDFVCSTNFRFSDCGRETEMHQTFRVLPTQFGNTCVMLCMNV